MAAYEEAEEGIKLNYVWTVWKFGSLGEGECMVRVC